MDNKKSESESKKSSISLRGIALSGLTNFCVLAAAIVFFFVIYKSDDIFSTIQNIVNILMPIIGGMVLAYLLGPIEERIEKGLDFAYKKISEKSKTFSKKKVSMRLPAVLISIILAIAVIILLLSMVLPEIINNISNAVVVLPDQLRRAYMSFEEFVKNNERISNIVNQFYDTNYDQMVSEVTDWLKNNLLNQVSLLLNGMIGVFKAIVNIIVAVVVAIYVLTSKETLAGQCKKLMAAFLNDRQTAKMTEIIKECDKIFGGFISGKIIDSLIIGIICFIVALIFQFPYAMLISVIVGVTNVIPFFGPYIGAIPSAILILLVSPAKGIEFIVFIIILQQFDGNILGPRILGNSTGLSPFWIIFAIMLGSGLFGIVGMLIGVPTFGVIYYLIKSFVYYRLEKKGKIKSAEKNL